MTTIERFRKILVQHYKLDPARLSPDQPLGSLGIDSLGMVEMLFFIEEEFGVHLPSEGVSFDTLGEGARYIDELVAAQAHGEKRGPATGAPATSTASADRGS